MQAGRLQRWAQPARTTPGPFSALLKVGATALVVASISAAHAGVFDDEEARKQILQLRSQVTETQRGIDQRVAELEAQARNRSIIDLFNQVETLKTEFARLRGQIEVLQNEMENSQKRQRDLYVDLDGRLRKMEAAMAEQAARAAQAPAAAPSVAVLGAAAQPGSSASDPSRALPPAVATLPPVLDPVAEQRAYDQGLEHFRAGRFGEAVTAFQLFTRNFARSTLVPSAQYWIGNSLYAVRDFRGAIATQRQLLTQFPDSAKASDALLNIASAQGELGDLQGSRATMQEVVAKYPNSEAGIKAKQRLGIR